VKLFPHEGRLELISKHLSEISNGDYFGAIMASPMALLKKDDALFSRMRASGFPMVFIGGGINCWSVDDMLYACGYTGTKHLIEQGYKKIGIIGSRAYNGEEFVEGCKKALEDAEMTDTATGYADEEAFALKMLDLWMSVDNKPDALFYQRSDYGDKCFQWLQSKRIQIGPEMGFIAIDDTAFHKYTIPSPTAVRMFPHKIGKQAVDLFLELVTLPKKERLVAKRIDADFNLNQGRSSQKGPKGRQIYHAVNPMPGVQDMGNSYYPPEPPMPPGYWNGFNQY
jgi:DNA-binding LacI/PurR family transcriptional regulator